MALVNAVVCRSYRGQGVPWARASANTVRVAAIHHLEQGGGCPTVAELKERRRLDRELSPKDLWGNPYVIECDGADVVVSTAGPDRKPGTQDDIVVPSR